MNIIERKRTIGTIPVLEVIPKNHRNEALPLIIYYHGWQSTKELTLTQARQLARLNCRVILPDAMNHGERKRPVSKIPSHTFWESIHSNLLEFSYILSYLNERRMIDKDKIAVGGVSMGGITTCALLTHHPEIKAAACVMGSPKLVAYRERIAKHVKERAYHFPDDYQDLFSWHKAYDLSLHPDTLNGRPFLIWHGFQDTVVPYDHVKEFMDKNNHRENIIFIKDDIDHLVNPKTMQKITDFFKENFIKP